MAIDWMVNCTNTSFFLQIQDLVSDVSALEVSEIMQLIDWLEYYVHQAGVFALNDHQEDARGVSDRM